MSGNDYISLKRSDLMRLIGVSIQWFSDQSDQRTLEEIINDFPDQKVFNIHEVAEILAEAFGDVCACNFNGNDEWLPELCEFGETVCPDPAGVACWEQYLIWKDKRSKETRDDLD